MCNIIIASHIVHVAQLAPVHSYAYGWFVQLMMLATMLMICMLGTLIMYLHIMQQYTLASLGCINLKWLHDQ